MAAGTAGSGSSRVGTAQAGELIRTASKCTRVVLCGILTKSLRRWQQAQLAAAAAEAVLCKVVS
jgi:hypothetical protein